MRVANIAFGVCTGVEVAQLYCAAWINGIRAHPLGHLALGSAYNPLDLFAYDLGVTAGYGLDRLIFLRKSADR